MGRMAVDIMGRRFGRLTVLGSAGSDRHGHALWHCQCDCGHHVTISGYTLRSGASQSCGCLFREICVSAGAKGGRIAWQHKCAGRPYPPAAIQYVHDATLSPAQQRCLARELARVLLVEGRGDPDYGTAFELGCRARLYPHLTPALPAESKAVAA